jgi:hypothetical protein
MVTERETQEMTATDWLEHAEEELAKILTSLMQVPRGSKGVFLDLILGKAAATSTGVGILGLISTFGTASTGTAIASLSGAAATSSQLAWMGSLIGGGMFAGTLLTGGLGLAAGYFAIKFINGRPRELEELNDIEKNIFASCSYFLKTVKDEINHREATEDQLKEFAISVRELCSYIDKHTIEMDDDSDLNIGKNLALKHLWNLTASVGRLDTYCEEYVS